MNVEEPGGEGLFGLDTSPEEAEVVVVPVPFEPTVSYGRGTAGGPQAIRAASGQLDLFDAENGRPYAAGIAMLEEDADLRAWNREACALADVVHAAGGARDERLAGLCREVDALGARVNAWLSRTVEPLLANGRLVGVLGGDHSVPFASIVAHARRFPGLGVLHFDAHADLRRAYEGFTWSHASIFHNVLEATTDLKLVGVGYRDVAESEHRRIDDDPRIKAFPDALLRARLFAGEPFLSIAREVAAALPEQVYVSFDIDGLDPALCPHTGTPVPGGLSFAEACCILGAVVDQGKHIVGFDLCEVAPDPTGHSEWDGNVGARVLYKLIGYALRSRPHA